MPGAAMVLTRQLNESFREAQINPSIVVIIIILTIIFFLSGCLHLLIRCLVMRNPRRDASSIVSVNAYQGQLQQLFHLHDSGVEQAFIDTLPVFFYKSVTGLKEGADCAVCLCEFESEDRLRLLPKCSHAFHMDCIDTWLLSHSTCPLCRRSLLADDGGFAIAHQGLLLESSRSSVDAEGLQRAASERAMEVASSAEIGADMAGSASPTAGSKPYAGSGREAGAASVLFPEGHPQSQYAGKVMAVQLGRFRVLEGGTDHAGVSSSITGSRRSYSVGSYEYVLDPWSSQVLIAPTPLHRRSSTPRRPMVPGHRATLSECAEEDVIYPDALVTPAHFFNSPFVADLMQGPRPRLASNPLSELASESNRGSRREADGGNIVSRARAFSFRHPTSQESLKLKASASRRSLSETDQVLDRNMWDSQAVHDPAFSSGAHLVAASTELSNSVPTAPGAVVNASLRSAAAVPLVFAKRTFNWLIGRQQRWTASSHEDSVLV